MYKRQISGGVAGAVAGSAVAGKRAERKNTVSKENRGNTTSSFGNRAGSKVGAVLDKMCIRDRFKREFSKLIGFLVVALIAVGLVFNAGGVKDVLLELFNRCV